MDKDVVCVCACVRACVYTMEYYSSIKMNEILKFAIMRMEIENIMLSKISQSQTNTMWFYSYVEFKERNKQKEKKEGTG